VTGKVSRPIRFTATLFRYAGKGGWTFAPVPKALAPKPTRPWGRTPVDATVDGVTWRTSLWRDSKNNRSLLAVPKSKRPGKGHGDEVTVVVRVVELDRLT